MYEAASKEQKQGIKCGKMRATGEGAERKMKARRAASLLLLLLPHLLLLRV